MRPTPVLIAIVVLALWLGGALLVAGVVAPAAFAVLPTRTLAGALVGRVLPSVFWSGMVVGVVSIAVSRSSGAGMTATIGGIVTLLACAVAQLVISPRIERVRATIMGPVEALDASDFRRLEFGRLHGLSVLTMGIAGVGAIIALVVLIRFIAARSAP